MRHKDKQCSVCGYIPNDEDIEQTYYQLLKCTCGQANVCDLCITYSYDVNEKFITGVKCPACSDIEPLGKNRKELLEGEYYGNKRS